MLYQKLNINTITITNQKKLLTFTKINNNHHLPNKPISSTYTLKTIKTNKIIYTNNNKIPYHYSLHPQYKLKSTLIIPLHNKNQQIINTIKLYKTKNHLFNSINHTLNKKITQLLSTQILTKQYKQQKTILTQSKIKLLHTQINPHFLFNTLNTIKTIIHRNNKQTNQLIQYLSTFFHKNLKQPSKFITLTNKIKHINTYLQIKKTHFQSQLQINITIPQKLSQQQLPTFTLQPIIKNTIKHKTSQLLNTKQITINTQHKKQHLILKIKNNTNLYQPITNTNKLKINLINKHLHKQFNNNYKINITYKPNNYTQITLQLP